MAERHAPEKVEAAARQLAADLEWTVPVRFDGEDGWLAVAGRALAEAAGTASMGDEDDG